MYFACCAFLLFSYVKWSKSSDFILYAHRISLLYSLQLVICRYSDDFNRVKDLFYYLRQLQHEPYSILFLCFHKINEISKILFYRGPLPLFRKWNKSVGLCFVSLWRDKLTANWMKKNWGFMLPTMRIIRDWGNFHWSTTLWKVFLLIYFGQNLFRVMVFLLKIKWKEDFLFMFEVMGSVCVRCVLNYCYWSVIFPAIN